MKESERVRKAEEGGRERKSRLFVCVRETYIEAIEEKVERRERER